MRFDNPELVDTSAGRVAVHQAGQGSPVVLLHGLFGASPVWSGVAPLLAARHRVLAVDLLGFGHSERVRDAEALWAPSQAAAIGEALDALGVGPAAFVGYDYGGPVALTLSARAPQRVTALTLSATNAFPDAPMPFPLSLLFLPVVGGAAEAALFSRPGLAMAARAAVGTKGVRLDRWLLLGDRAQSRAVRTLFKQALRQMPARYGPVHDALTRLDVPTLVVWGDRDPFFALEQGRRTAAAVRGAQLRVYDGAGHFVPEEQPERFAADVLALLARVGAA
ncbi:MAG TPA: alpha/beta hydrolase [Egibacteraceae bacterium]|nr:alpha/beta hydrolase [Egibacteraceae bacterium]